MILKMAQIFFIARFNRFGECEWSTFFGGPYNERAMDMYIEYNLPSNSSLKQLYIVGMGNTSSPFVTSTTGHNFPSPSFPFGEGLILKLDYKLDVEWSSLYPVERIDGIVGDEDHNIHITGIAQFPYTIPTIHYDYNYSSTNNYSGFMDAFVATFNTNEVLLMSQYIGGNYADAGTDIDVNEEVIIITGYTRSDDFICVDYDASNPNDFFVDVNSSVNGPEFDAFITTIKRDPIGIIEWSTYYGGGDDDWGRSVALDSDGNIIIYGFTKSGTNTNLPKIPFPNQNPQGVYVNTDKFGNEEEDAFIAYFSKDAKHNWTTYFGGSDADYGLSCGITPITNKLYIVGQHFWTPTWPWATFTGLNYVEDPSGISGVDLFNSDPYFDYSITNPSYTTSEAFIARFSLPQIQTIVGDNKIPSNSDISIYPNPSNKLITIINNGNSTINQIELYSSTGTLIVKKYYNNNSDKVSVDISNVNTGLYNLIIYNSEKRIFSQKIIKL